MPTPRTLIKFFLKQISRAEAGRARLNLITRCVSYRSWGFKDKSSVIINIVGWVETWLILNDIQASLVALEKFRCRIDPESAFVLERFGFNLREHLDRTNVHRVHDFRSDIRRLTSD
jgi:hypothetical protein